MILFRLLIIIPVLVFTSHLGAVQSHDDQIVDTITYDEVRDYCYSVISYFRYDLSVWNWSDHFMKEQLRELLERYLLECINTPESRKLFQKYEEVDWDVKEMMRIYNLHLDE